LPPLIASYVRMSEACALAAVDVQNLAGDERGLHEAHDRLHNVAYLGHSPERVQCGERAAGCIGVRTTPSETALTRMFRATYSMANSLVAATRPPLVSAVSAAGMDDCDLLH